MAEKKIEEIESVPNGNSAGSSAAADEPILFPLQGDPILLRGTVLFFRCGRFPALLISAREVRYDSENAFDQHQLSPVVHFVLFH